MAFCVKTIKNRFNKPPVGSLLIWYGQYEESRTVDDARQPDAWVVDGQQRTTALCLLFGRRPFWWEEGWNELLERHGVRFNVLADEEPYFSLRIDAMRGSELAHLLSRAHRVLIAGLPLSSIGTGNSGKHTAGEQAMPKIASFTTDSSALCV